MENNQINTNESTYVPRSKRHKKEPKKRFNLFKLVRNIVIVIILLLISLFVLDKAPNYKNRDITDRTNVIINNKNITAYLKKDLLIENDCVYLSKQDVSNFFDPYLYYNETEKRIVITYDTKVTNMFLDNTRISINDMDKVISAPAVIRNDIVYIPVSELSDAFNTELKYNQDTNIVTIDTITKKQVVANATKNLSVKSIRDTFSRTVAKIKKDDAVVIIEKDEEKGWTKVRTSNGVIGYIENKNLTNETTTREDVVQKPQIEGKVNMVWDNFYSQVPDRTGTTIDGVNVVSPSFFVMMKNDKGGITDKAGTDGMNYVKWAKSNNYKVWAMVTNIANESMIDTTSEILNSYELRNKTINNILALAEKYHLDGINIDFENIYQKDKDMFTQFIVELYPRLKEKNMTLSVDVTAPDGGETWSLCFDRHDIANNCDYIVFMAYDQYSDGSTSAGSTAALNWVKIGLNKFLKTEEIKSEKIILAIPFYTRLWTENSSGKIISRSIVDMKNVTSTLPTSVYNNKTWNEDLGQYYVEYSESGNTKKMWIEDERSITAKLNLIKENNLGGVAFWAKGRETSTIWNVIKTELQ